MSDRRICKLDIKNANEATLKQSVEILGKMLGAQMVNSVEDFYGKKIEASGFKTAGISRGIGFRVENGEIVSDGDPYGCRDEYSRVEGLLKQTYGYVDTCNKLKSKGFMVNSSIKIYGNKIQATVEGMKNA